MFKPILTGLLLLSLPGFAQTPPGVRSWEKNLSPGVLYRMEADFSKPLTLHAVRVTPSGGTRLVSALGGGTVFAAGAAPARSAVSEMAAQAQAAAAVNADFFPASGDPLGLMIMNGEVVSRPWPGRSFAAWGPGRIFIGKGGFRGEAKLPDGVTLALEGINEEATDSRIVLNRPIAGAATLKDQGLHVVLDAPGKLLSGAVVEGRVLRTSTEKSLVLGSGESSLSANGDGAERLKGLKAGDRVAFSVEFTGFDPEGLTEGAAGGPLIVREGQPAVESELENFRKGFDTERHPRTAFGVTPNGEVWLVVVDGRQPGVSRGATLAELAQIMVRLGCREAINLDGGGSSEITAWGLTVNRPSDGKPRPVANGILVLAPIAEPEEGPMVIAGKNYLQQGLYSQYRVIDGRGREVPVEEVVWSAEGPGWIDQGGFLRWVGPGEVTVRARAKGRQLELRVQSEPPAAASPVPAGVTKSPQ
jgi:uncharacterized protein YigE (DUF2233 family)